MKLFQAVLSRVLCVRALEFTGAAKPPEATEGSKRLLETPEKPNSDCKRRRRLPLSFSDFPVQKLLTAVYLNGRVEFAEWDVTTSRKLKSKSIKIKVKQESGTAEQMLCEPENREKNDLSSRPCLFKLTRPGPNYDHLSGPVSSLKDRFYLLSPSETLGSSGYKMINVHNAEPGEPESVHNTTIRIEAITYPDLTVGFKAAGADYHIGEAEMTNKGQLVCGMAPNFDHSFKNRLDDGDDILALEKEEVDPSEAYRLMGAVSVSSQFVGVLPFTGHTEPVISMRKFYLGSIGYLETVSSKAIRIWNLSTGRCLKSYDVEEQLTSDSDEINLRPLTIHSAVTFRSGTSTSATKKFKEEGSASLDSLSVLVVPFGGRSPARIWNPETRELQIIQSSQPSKTSITSADVSPDGNLIATVSIVGEIDIWGRVSDKLESSSSSNTEWKLLRELKIEDISKSRNCNGHALVIKFSKDSERPMLLVYPSVGLYSRDPSEKYNIVAWTIDLSLSSGEEEAQTINTLEVLNAESFGGRSLREAPNKLFEVSLDAVFY